MKRLQKLCLPLLVLLALPAGHAYGFRVSAIGIYNGPYGFEVQAILRVTRADIERFQGERLHYVFVLRRGRRTYHFGNSFILQPGDRTLSVNRHLPAELSALYRCGEIEVRVYTEFSQEDADGDGKQHEGEGHYNGLVAASGTARLVHYSTWPQGTLGRRGGL